MNLLDILRDQAWQGIGAIIAVIALLLTIFLEWPRFKKRGLESRLGQDGSKHSLSGILRGLSIFLMLFVIMGSTGSLIGYLGIDVDMLSFLIILGIVFINVAFLMFLKFKQPAM